MTSTQPKCRRAGRAAALASAIALVTVAPVALRAADITWITPGTGDYLVPANWQGGAVPASPADNGLVNNGATVTLSGAAPAAGGIVLGDGVGNSGTFTVAPGGSANFTGPLVNPPTPSRGLKVGLAGGTGTLNITGGSLTIGSETGITRIGGGLGSVGNLNMTGGTLLTQGGFTQIGDNNGTATATLSGDARLISQVGTLVFGNARVTNTAATDGDLNLPTVGNVTLSGTASMGDGDGTDEREFWLGNGSTFAQSSMVMNDDSTVNFGSWCVIGRGGASATAEMNDNAVWTHSGGGNFIVGDGPPLGPNPETDGTLTMNDNARISNNNEFWVGQGANTTGVMTMNGNTELTSSGWIAIGRDTGVGTAVMNGTSRMIKGTGSGNYIIGSLSGDGTLTMNDATSVTVTQGSSWFAEGDGASATLVMNDSATWSSQDQLRLSFAGGVTDITLNDNAAMTKGDGGGFGGTGMIVGDFNGTATFTLNNASTLTINAGDMELGAGDAGVGTVNVNGTAQLIMSEGIKVGSGLAGNGTFNLNGGLVRVEDVTFGNTFATVAAGEAQVGTFNLNGGVLQAITVGRVADSLGTQQFNWNGGTLRAFLATTSLFTLDASRSEVLAGGATIDTNGFAVSIGVPLDGVGGLTKVGAGTLTFTAVPQTQGPLVVNAGTLALPAPGGTAPQVLRSNAVTVASGAVLNLNAATAVFDYTTAGQSPAETLRQTLAGGLNRISLGGAVPAGQAIGYAEASALTTVPAVFGTVDSTALLVRITLRGDVNLDRAVGFADLGVVALNYNTGSGKFWYQGDFNYDGLVTFPDLAALAAAYNTALPSPLMVSSVYGEDFAAQWALALAAAVPEPTALLAAAAGAGVLGLRRRK